MLKFSHFSVKKLYFKRSFNNIGENRGSFFSQINFDQTFWRVLSGGFLARGFMFISGVYVLQPVLHSMPDLVALIV